LTNVVNAYVLGIDAGYELPEESRNACPSVGCPLSGKELYFYFFLLLFSTFFNIFFLELFTGGENIDFNLSVVVSAPITGVVATLQYQMVNENNDVMVCFRATANII
jgi:hypothetical protein